MNQTKILRDPGTDSNALPPDGAAGATPPAAASAFDASKYVPKQDYDTMRGEFDGFKKQFSETIDGLRNFGKPKANEGPKEPNPAEYNFAKPEEVRRWYRDNYKWDSHTDAQEKAQRETREAPQRNQQEIAQNHLKREAAYTKEHPEYQEDIRKMGSVQVEQEIVNAIHARKNSPEILHYIAKNPSLVNDLRACTDMDEASDIIADIAADIRRDNRDLENNAKAAQDRPLRMNQNSLPKNSAKTPSKADLVKNWRSL